MQAELRAISHTSPSIRVAALYQFTRFDEPAAVRQSLAALCEELDIKGTLLVAHEGLNGTIAGTDLAIERVLAHVRGLPGCADIAVKVSHAAEPPFARMKVKLKREIVTMGQPHVDPLAGVGHYVDPTDWNRLIDAPDTIVIDTRNDYEVRLGSFPGAVNPGTRSFREFPDWFRKFRAERGQDRAMPPIAMFCTGGIRCEKATAFLKAEGLDDVHHLRGGILAYLEAVPPETSRWQGECFVFDERVTVDDALEPGHRTLCPSCQRPVDGANCLTCSS